MEFVANIGIVKECHKGTLREKSYYHEQQQYEMMIDRDELGSES